MVGNNLASGDFDSTFGIGGKVTTVIGNDVDAASSVVLQSDGKILVVGTTLNGNSLDTVLVRYNPDGSLDTTFGTGGKVTADFGGKDDFGYDLVLQPDGNIVIVGSTSDANGSDFILARYTANGALDTSFGTGGKVVSDLSPYDDAYSLSLQADGTMWVVGSINDPQSGSDDIALVRYTPNGALDTSLQGTGVITTDFGANDYGYSLAVQTDGKVVVVGETVNSSGSDFVIARYNSDGGLDSGFGGGDGKVTDNFKKFDYGSRVLIQPDGKILVGGYSSSNAQNYTDFTLARYNADGSPDLAFGAGGKTLTPLGISENAKVDIALLPNGKIVAAGTIDGDMAVLRYNSDGTLDQGFGGGGGKVITDFGGSDSGSGLVIQSDSKLVVVGATGGGDFALARYIGNVPATDILLSNSAIAEGSANQTVVGTLTSIDPDTNDPQIYTLLDDAAGRFALSGNTITVANGALLDFETTAQHTIRVRTTDSSNASFDKDLTLSLLDVNESPNSPNPPNTKVEDFPATTIAFGTALRPINFKVVKPGVRLNGTSKSEKLRGTFNSDVMYGNGGNDRIIAGAGKPRFGRDRIYGGKGDDILFAGRGNDQADGGAGNDQIRGGGENDLLLGKSGVDTLYGGSGNDILVGGSGSDRLIGGKGRDTFVFNSVTEGIDTITDFSVTQDLIDLRKIFAQPEFAGSSLVNRFNQFVDIVQVGADTVIQLDADGSGSGIALQPIAILQNLSASSLKPLNFIPQ